MKWLLFKKEVERMGLRDDDDVREINWRQDHTFSGIELERVDADFVNNPLVESSTNREVVIRNDSN